MVPSVSLSLHHPTSSALAQYESPNTSIKVIKILCLDIVVPPKFLFWFRGKIASLSGDPRFS